MDILQKWHVDLTPVDLAGLRALFDAEYRCTFGDWDPEAPYGYSPAELHTMAVAGDGAVVGHVGTQRRIIRVGDRATVVETTGAPVLICSGTEDVSTWPSGIVELCGTPW